MPHIEAELALVRMTFDDLQDVAGYVCTKRDFASANGDDEDEEEDEEEEKKKEKDEEDEDDDDDDDGEENDAACRTVAACKGKLHARTRPRSQAGDDFASRALSWIDPAIRARVGIAIDEDPAGVLGMIRLASVDGVRA